VDPIRGARHPKERWSWTDPIVVHLDGKTTALRVVAKTSVGIESVRLDGDCGRPSSPKCSRPERAKPPGKKHCERQ
jgi:hypothetical protein